MFIFKDRLMSRKLLHPCLSEIILSHAVIKLLFAGGYFYYFESRNVWNQVFLSCYQPTTGSLKLLSQIVLTFSTLSNYNGLFPVLFWIELKLSVGVKLLIISIDSFQVSD